MPPEVPATDPEAAELPHRPCRKCAGALDSLTTKSAQNQRIGARRASGQSGLRDGLDLAEAFAEDSRPQQLREAAPVGPERVWAPDVLPRGPAQQPPFCRMCLRLLFRF